MNTSASRPPGPSRRRTIPIIDARFQWKYTLLVTALGVGVTTFMGGLLYKAHLDNTRLLDIDERLREQVIRGDQIFLLYLVVGVVAMAVILSIWGLIVTHRISGPLYLVARYLNVLASGQYPDIRPLRSNDELRELFGSLEDAVATLRARDEASLRAIADVLQGAETEKTRARLAVIHDELKAALGQDVDPDR